MTSFSAFSGSVARHILVIKATRKAAKEFKKEIEKAELDNLKTLAEAGVSIVGTYLNGCSPEEKKRRKQELIILFQMGVTPDMLLDEISKLMPEIGAIMEGRDGYKRSEIQNLERFLKEG